MDRNVGSNPTGSTILYKFMEDITEKVLIRLFDNKFGTKISGRCVALAEEFGEFLGCYDENKITEHMIDEAADLYSVALHLIHCVGLNHQEAMNMTWDKIKTREIDPNYKKDWSYNSEHSEFDEYISVITI